MCFVSTEAIESVMVTNSSAPINSENFTLTCEVIGPYTSISWNIKLSTVNPVTSFYIENNTLDFFPVTLDYEGTYQCIAKNEAGSHESPKYKLLVNCEYCRKQLSLFHFK